MPAEAVGGGGFMISAQRSVGLHELFDIAPTWTLCSPELEVGTTPVTSTQCRTHVRCHHSR
jgi:hypothetical protein